MKWIKTGWGEDFSQNFSPHLPFRFDCSNKVLSNKPFFQIAKEAIYRITLKYPEPYYLLCSGGVDSQVMAYLWQMSGVKFKVISFAYNRIYNRHDLKTLSEFSTKNDIKVNYLNFDLFSFLENELDLYSQTYQCRSPQICSYMKMSESIKDGTILFSGNFIFPDSCNLNYTILGLNRYANITKRSMIPFFLQHDPELAPSLISVWENNSNVVIKWNMTNGDYLPSTYENKVKLYELANIPVIKQPKKYSGFELVKDYYDKMPHLVSIEDKVKFSRRPSKRVFDINFRYKLYENLKYKEELNYIF